MRKIILVGLGLAVAGMGVYFGYRYYTEMAVVEKPLVPVKIMLKWLHQSQFAGIYMAKDKGWYKNEGLGVTIIQFDPKVSYIDMVATGSAEFGVAGADEILLARSMGKPVVALAAIYQESPVTVYTLKSSGITNVSQLKGKRLGFQQSSNVIMGVDAMLSAGGLNPQKDVIRKEIGFGIEELITGKVDAMTGYMTNEPLTAEAEGYAVNLIKPSQYGIIDYADVLFTSEAMIKDHPDLVKGYTRATLAGWEYTLDNQDEAVEVVMKYVSDNSKKSKNHQKQMLLVSEGLIRLVGTQPLGLMSYSKWHRLYEEMTAVNSLYGIISNLSEAYTQDFLVR